jgi:hypothetical protein
MDEILPRVIAFVLGLGGLILGALFFGFFLNTPRPNLLLPALVFGPGTLVTLYCFVRAAVSPRLRLRQAFWATSILVHCSFLVVTLGEHIGRGIPGKPFGPPATMTWWAFAVIASAIALSLESDQL